MLIWVMPCPKLTWASGFSTCSVSELSGRRAFEEMGLQDNPFSASGLAANFKRQWNKCKSVLTSHSDYAELVSFLKNKTDKKYHNGCALSLICQSFEALIVYNLMTTLQADGFVVRSYEYDGINIEATPDEIDTALTSISLPIPFKDQRAGHRTLTNTI